MENIAFHTAAIKTGGSNGSANSSALSGSGKGVMALGGGMNFFDLMFARLAGAGTSEITKGSQSGALKASNLLSDVKVTELPDGTLGVSLGENGLDLEASELLTTKTDSNLLKDISAKKKFLEFLDTLLAGIPEGEKPAIDLSGKLTKKDLLNSATAEFPGLIATGLKPGQLATAMEKFGRDILQQYEGNEEIQGVIVGLIKMMPPQSNSGFDAIIMPKALFVSKDGNGTPMTGQAASSSPSSGQTAPAGPLSLNGQGSSYNPMTPLTADEAMLAAAAKGKGGQEISGKVAGMETLAGKGGEKADAASASFAFLSGFEFPFPGDIFSADNWSDPVLDKLGMQSPGQNTSHQASLTQMVTQAPQAGSAHPSTQIVAAHLQKMAANSDTRNMTLDMDPPDLGRVKVQMEYNVKEKTVKAHMLIEKPETYLMLQRDSHALERALQEAGLEVGGESLEFELAQDGQDFTHDGSHDGNSNGYSSGGETGGEEIEVIETTMNWYIDPETGAQRYDLLV